MENPRQVFHPTTDDRLAQSIETSGVLVPIYVYREGTAYRLIDGERRWRQATRLGLATIPALVREEPPAPTENIVEMFNIHLVRAQWDDMPTALALEKVMERARTDDPEELKKLTGLSKEKIKDYKLILDLPERYKQLIWDGLPMNFFVEIEENVIRPLTRQRPLVWQEFGGDAIRDAFLAKRDAGALTDVVDVRKMRPIIKRAAEDAGGPETASPFDDVIRDLILDPASSIEESYAEVALAGVELSRLAGSARSLIAAVDRLIGVTEGNESEREQLRTVVTDTQVALQARLDALPE